MKYSSFKAKQSEDFNAFPLTAAFSNSQLAEAKTKLGVSDNSELLDIWGGCLIRKTDHEAFRALNEKQNSERIAYLADPDNLKSAFVYELGNHEYIYTYDYADTLEALGFTLETMTPEQKRILKEAKAQYLETAEA